MRGGGRLVGRQVAALILTAVWLVYLASPIQEAWAQRGTPTGLVGVVALVAFAGIYVVQFTLWRLRSGSLAHPGDDGDRGPRPFLLIETGGLPGESVTSWGTNVRFGILTVLAVVATATTGQAALATWVFLAIAGLFTFRLAIAGAVGLVITVGLVVAPSVVPGLHPDASAPLSAVLAMLAVGAGITVARRNRQLGEAQAENARLELEQAVERERSRVARDLHDILGHSLTVVAMKTDLARRLLDHDPDRARAELVDAERLARDALADVRSTIAGLNVPTLPGELAQAQAALAAAEVDADLPTHTDDVPSDRRELFAWAIREAVTNVVRHSHASRCTITLDADEVRIVDDGTGCPDLDQRPGSGLRGLRERADLWGATVVTETLAPHGFSVAVTMGSRP